MLARPIAELVLRQREEDGLWAAVGGEGLAIYDTEAMGRFVGIVAAFAEDKQQRELLARYTPDITSLL